MHFLFIATVGELITEALYVKKEREGDCPAVDRYIIIISVIL